MTKGQSIDYLNLGHTRQTRLLARVARAHLKAGNYDEMLDLLTTVALDKQAEVRTRVQAALGVIRSADRLATALRQDEALRNALPPAITINIGVPAVRDAMPAPKTVEVQTIPAVPVPPPALNGNGHANGHMNGSGHPKGGQTP